MVGRDWCCYKKGLGLEETGAGIKRSWGGGGGGIGAGMKRSGEWKGLVLV